MVDLDDELVRLAFEALDLDGRGEVDMEEMITVLTNIGGQPLTRAEVEAFFGHIDENRSGAIDIEEFVQFLVKELIATEDMRVKFSQEIELVSVRVVGLARVRPRARACGPAQPWVGAAVPAELREGPGRGDELGGAPWDLDFTGGGGADGHGATRQDDPVPAGPGEGGAGRGEPEELLRAQVARRGRAAQEPRRGAGGG